jgi:flavodoxin
MFEIKPISPYPDNDNQCVEQAKEEQKKNARPEISNPLENVDSYEVIFLGYPNWWRTMPMLMFTFLEKYNFSDKIIVPFCTHEGGGFGRSESDISSLSEGYY